ncbi:MAG: hypothetical protein WD045_08940 [Pirellulaceae bacterium]
MASSFDFDILPQPDDVTCGPTCLQAVYRHYGLELDLPQLIGEVPQLQDGGTLAVMLGIDALKRGFAATIYTFNLKVFDPTWFLPLEPGQRPVDLADRLRTQLTVKRGTKLTLASSAYIEFLERGGQIKMRDLNAMLISRFLHRGTPILTGLSATYLYFGKREFGPKNTPDDIRGVPQGHFVVLCGMDEEEDRVHVADPYLPNPLGLEHHYAVEFDRLVCSILLGILTYDSNLLVIEPVDESQNGVLKRGQDSF